MREPRSGGVAAGGRGGERAGGYRAGSGREYGNSSKRRHVVAFAHPKMATSGAEAAQLTIVHSTSYLSRCAHRCRFCVRARWGRALQPLESDEAATGGVPGDKITDWDSIEGGPRTDPLQIVKDDSVRHGQYTATQAPRSYIWRTRANVATD